jgi:hypothetical protein
MRVFVRLFRFSVASYNGLSWTALVCCEKEQPTLSALSGGIFGIETSQDTNFAASIRSVATYSISSLQLQSWRSN